MDIGGDKGGVGMRLIGWIGASLVVAATAVIVTLALQARQIDDSVEWRGTRL